VPEGNCALEAKPAVTSARCFSFSRRRQQRICFMRAHSIRDSTSILMRGGLVTKFGPPPQTVLGSVLARHQAWAAGFFGYTIGSLPSVQAMTLSPTVQLAYVWLPTLVNS
jgi:hypothetical protein